MPRPAPENPSVLIAAELHKKMSFTTENKPQIEADIARIKRLQAEHNAKKTE